MRNQSRPRVFFCVLAEALPLLGQALALALTLAMLTLGLSGCLTTQNSSGGCTPNPVPTLSGSISGNIRTEDVSHVPQAYRNYADDGNVAEENDLGVTVVLALNHEDELDQRIAEMYQPGHADFHRFLKPEEFRARYAPSATQVAAAQDYLSARGLQSAAVDASGYLIHAHGAPRAIGDAFNTDIHAYHDAEGRSHFAPASEPMMPAGVGIRAVHGLTDSPLLKSFARPAMGAPQESTDGSGNGGSAVGLSPAMIRSTYNLPSNLSGSGQTIALVELDGYSASDISTYAETYGLRAPSIRNRLVDGFNGTPGSGASEVTLDIELALAVAPGAQIAVYEGPNSIQTLLDIFGQIAADGKASQVSISWGTAETEVSTAFLQSENAVLKQLAAQGQAVFVASGDSGAYDDGSSLSVQDPASQPFVVAVGGTTLQTQNGSYGGESVWNQGSASAGAGGGGISAAWPQPSWQNGIETGRNLGSSSMRNVPDVSLNADPATGYAIAFQGGWTRYGGTSAAAPIWAAFLALVNQNRTAGKLPPIGFPNPAFYAIGKGSRYLQDFHDIDDGSNNLYYPSVSGFDDATGWGTPNGQNLLQDLSSEPASSTSDLGC